MPTRPKYDKSRCGVDSCPKEYYTKGYCRLHYQRSAKGRPLEAAVVDRRTHCSIEGCDRKHQAKGLCGSHYMRTLKGTKTQAPIGEREPCELEGCDKRQHVNGLCVSHYAEKKRLDSPKFCSIEGCLRKFHSNGLCEAHNSRQKRGKSLDTPLAGRRRTSAEMLARDTEGHKYCPKCTNWLPEDCFRAQTTSSDLLACYCKICTDWSNTLGRYALTADAYVDLVSAQGDSCAICGTDEPGGRNARWCIDHDHSCCPGERTCGNCIRGLLCLRCNSGLGMFADNIYNIQAALSYLNEASIGRSISA